MIVWGTKIVRKNLGYAADFCPICREPQVFRIDRVGKASHLYFVALGSGQLLGHERCCDSCGTTLATELDRYQSISKKKWDVGSLGDQTFPALGQVYADRLAMEERVRSRQLAAEERRGLLQEPFAITNSLLEERQGINMDAASGFGCVAALMVPFVLAVVLDAVVSDTETRGWILMGSFAALVGLFLFLQAREPGRFLRRKVYPSLVRALTPLEPSVIELEETLGTLRDAGLKIGKKARAQVLFEDLSLSPRA